ncbi:hypothetical protein F8388_017327 [Cannabis sativa]|uniref:Uncharacterized protein n=2 Tax=Cannabis sativa TaxID=3483 RepID=A0AB40E7C8_CANSA|nr:hypothetical protein F8388_017327 [Cannabis sativa]KAF4402079.1 hypothetical protein G4B88_017591 [Cannabis sativa]
MSHRKVYSQGSIPFSWEDKPGISKVAQQNPRVQALDLTSSPSPSPSISNTNNDLVKLKIPLPPCPTPSQPPSRSNSAKGLKWQEDPFLLAYKECTKPQKKGNNKKASKVRKTMFMYFSCKSSCDVRNENFVKLPTLPTHKLQNVVMENW